MGPRSRQAKWPPWTQQHAHAHHPVLTEPLRSTLRRIDEQFLAINELVLEPYYQWPGLNPEVDWMHLSMLEQDEAYLDDEDGRMEQHEDTALLGRLADLVCPEIWADFFTDVKRMDPVADNAKRDAGSTMVAIARRRNVAAELYDGVQDLLQDQGITNVSLGIELKITLLATLLVVGDASQAPEPFQTLYGGLKRYENFTVRGKARAGQRSAVQRLTRSDIATLVAVTSTAVVACMLAFIPAWRNTAQGVGSTNDMDFWCLVQSEGMQLLGIFTAVFPMRRLAFDARGASAQLWVYVFTVLGVVVTLCALPLYLFASVFWSSVLLFLGSAAQAFLVLQLALIAGIGFSDDNIKQD